MYTLMTQRSVSNTDLPSELQTHNTTFTWLLLMHPHLNIFEPERISSPQAYSSSGIFNFPISIHQFVHNRNVDVTLDCCLFLKYLSMPPYKWISNLSSAPYICRHSFGSKASMSQLNYSSSLPTGHLLSLTLAIILVCSSPPILSTYRSLECFFFQNEKKIMLYSCFKP